MSSEPIYYWKVKFENNETRGYFFNSQTVSLNYFPSFFFVENQTLRITCRESVMTMTARNGKLFWHSTKTNPKITILEILVYKIQPEKIKSKIFTCFNFITKPCSQKNKNNYSCEHGFVVNLERVKILDFIVSGFILYIKIFQNGYFWISLRTILFKIIYRKWISFWHTVSCFGIQ